MLAKDAEKGRGHKQRSSEQRINLRGCGSAEFGPLLVAVSCRIVNRVRQRGSTTGPISVASGCFPLSNRIDGFR
jgi:hypothetical protein